MNREEERERNGIDKDASKHHNNNNNNSNNNDNDVRIEFSIFEIIIINKKIKFMSKIEVIQTIRVLCITNLAHKPV